MKQLKKCSAIAVWLLSMALLVTACTKKRDAELPYGEDRDLAAIATFEGKEYDLQTFDVIKASNTNSKLKITDERKGSAEQKRRFDYVAYKSEDPLKLTDDTLMLGRPNHHYKVKYRFESNLLKVMKLAPAEDLSTDEQTVAIDNRDGRFMVPIVSYSASYYSIDKKRNDYNETTSKLELISLQGPTGATHFRIDLNSKTRASFLSKATVLPANFFEGEQGDSADWYFAFTITGQNAKERDLETYGYSMGFDKYMRTANKVRARKVEDKILFFNLEIDDRLKKSVDERAENQAVAVTLPADFIDYEFGASGKGTNVKEETSKDKAWNQRSHIELKLSEVKVPYFPLQITEILDVQISNGYFSFTVKSDEWGAVVRFSFYNVKAYQNDAATKFGAKPYQPKIYFPEDQKVFGFFSTTPERVGDFESNQKEITDRQTFVKRHNPTRSMIEYRLNQDAPDWAEDIVKKAINGWNATFETAGSSIRIKATDDQGKVLRGHVGDLRYNMINFQTEIDTIELPWGGLGPSLADPSGEIIMATANINAQVYVEAMKRTLNSYLRSMKGEFDSKYMMGFSFPAIKTAVDAATKQLKVWGARIGLTTGEVSIPLYNPSNQSLIKQIQIAPESKKHQLRFDNHSAFEDSFVTINKDLIETARQVCPELRNHADQLKANPKQEIEKNKEVQIISDCAIQISKPYIISTLAHELGHNMGLRHNFYGSNDKRNFFSETTIPVGDQKIKTQWKSSSVMDYMPLNYHTILQPGRYDIAAIRWAYTGTVETDSKQILKTSGDKPLSQQNLDTMRKFQYCTDEDVDVYARDPQCARMDVGTNPVEIVDNLIEEYQANMAVWNKRLGRERMVGAWDAAIYRYYRYIIPMRKYYEVWRLILKNEAGLGQDYLEKYETRQDYENLIKRVLDPKKQGEAEALRNKQYYEASQKIYKFLARIALMPDYSCIGEKITNGKSKIQLYSMSKLQLEIFNATRKTYTSCQQKEVQDYLSKTYGFKVLGEGGLAFNNIYSDLESRQMDQNSYEADEQPEILGIGADRFVALASLMMRSKALYSSYRQNLAPSYIDEWPYREDLKKKLYSRLLDGVNLKEAELDKQLGLKISEDPNSLSFESEKILLQNLVGYLKWGYTIPGKNTLTDQRVAQFTIIKESEFEDGDEKICVDHAGRSYCASKERHPEAYKLVQRYKELVKKREAKLVSPKAVQIVKDVMLPLIPKTGHEAEMTFQVHRAWLDKLEEIKKNNEPALEKEVFDLGFEVIYEEFKIWNPATKAAREQFKKEDLSQAQLDEKTNALRKLKLVDLAKKIDEKDYKGLSQETFLKRIDKYVADQKQALDEYLSQSSEFEAQADILMSSMFDE